MIRRAIDQFLERKKKGSLKKWSLIYISEGKDFDESKTTTIRQNGKYRSETKTRSFADNPLRETRMQISSLTKSACAVRNKAYVAPAKVPTVNEACKTWFEEKKVAESKHGGERKVSTLEYWRNHFITHILPAMGNLRIDVINIELAEKTGMISEISPTPCPGQ